jgi:hypothetical protein
VNEGPLSDYGEDSKKDSIINEPVKKVGHHTKTNKCETETNKEKDRGMQSTLDGVFFI